MHGLGRPKTGEKPAIAIVYPVEENILRGARPGSNDAGFIVGWKRLGRDMRFDIGEIIVTPAATDALVANGLTLDDLLARHRAGDWGDVSEQVREVNERGLIEQFNLQSTYRMPDGRRLVVVTHRDRTTTMVHLAPI
jgi:hypothetical protein